MPAIAVHRLPHKYALTLGVFSFLTAVGLSFPALSHAASFYVTPASKSVNGTFTVSVRENSGADAVNAVQASLSYSSDKLDFVSIGGGGPFNVVAQTTGGGGTVQIGKGLIGDGVSGDQLVGSVTFKVKPGATGTASVSFIGGSSIVRGSDQANVYNGGSGGTYTIGGSTGGSTGGGSTTTPTPTSEPIPVISDVKVIDVATNSATVTWTTNSNANSVVEYGLTSSYGLTESDDTLATTHSLTLSSALLVPGTTYHFHVMSKASETATPATSEDDTFTTKGYTVTLTIVDANNNPIANTTVTLVTANGTRTSTTDANGVVTFTDVPSGQQTALAGNGQQQSITVVDSPDPQKFTVRVLASSAKVAIPLWLTVSVVVIACLFLIIAPIRRRIRRRRDKQNPPSTPTGPSIMPAAPAVTEQNEPINI